MRLMLDIIGKSLFMSCLAFGVCACSSNKKVITVNAAEPITNVDRGGMHKFMPMAHIYKTNGDYASLVPITLNEERTAIVSFPAPGDLQSTAPIQLADGYLLDKRGVGENTAFTSYTYSQYMALDAAPSLTQLMDAIVPEARVIKVVQLPITLASATGDISRVNAIITNGLNGCEVLYDEPTVPDLSK